MSDMDLSWSAGHGSFKVKPSNGLLVRQRMKIVRCTECASMQGLRKAIKVVA